jgi:hypothetical protein
LKVLNVFDALGSEESGISRFTDKGRRGPIVDRNASKKDRRKKMTGVNKRMDQRAENGGVALSGEAPGAGPNSGLNPTLQAHIGRHVRAVFDEVAREPIPEHLLRLLNDLEQSGDK